MDDAGFTRASVRIILARAAIATGHSREAHGTIMSIQKLTGRAAFIKLLLDEGVTHLFGNPGTTELAIMEAVPQFPELTYVLGLQEIGRAHV